MRLVVDMMPKEPKNCLFSERSPISDNYLCKFHGAKVCEIDKCKHLREIGSFGFSYKPRVYR